MKFAEHLTAHLTPEWRTQYIEYDTLKDYLYKSLDGARNLNTEDEQIIRVHLDICDEVFVQMCENELTKINNFYAEKLAEAKRKFITLRDELHDYQEQHLRKTSWISSSRLSLSSKKKELEREREKERERQRRESTISKTKGMPRPSSFGNMLQKTQALRKEKKRVKKLHDVKLGFSEFYLSLILLQNYQTLNFTGFRKILKKHDKLFQTTTGGNWRSENVLPAPFNTNKDVDDLINKVETLYTKELEHGDRQRAMKRLRVPPLTEQQNPWTTFRTGFCFGIFLVQIVIIILSLCFLRPLPPIWAPALRIFRATFLTAFFLALLGMNTYGWRSSGVNHVLIFEIDPRNHLTHYELLEISGIFLVLWGLSVIYFLFSSVLGAPAYAVPFVLLAFKLGYLLNPLRIFHFRSRRWLLRILWRIFSAPFHRVNFADFWLADQLNSLVVLFIDVAFFFCFFTSQMNWTHFRPHAELQMSAQNQTVPVAISSDVCGGMMYGIAPIFRCLPAWFRFAQCLRRFRDMEVKKPFPHLVNAGKYSTTFFVVLFSTFAASYSKNEVLFAFWVLASLLSTIYTYSWDILMDWGLLDRESKDTFLLRDELVYHYRGYYYFGMFEDLVFRLAWTVDLAALRYGWPHRDILSTVLAIGEVSRRFIWNFFRLENEHLNNCGQFRAVRDIFIAPISRQGKDHPSGSRPAALLLNGSSVNSESSNSTRGAGRPGLPGGPGFSDLYPIKGSSAELEQLVPRKDDDENTLERRSSVRWKSDSPPPVEFSLSSKMKSKKDGHVIVLYESDDEDENTT